MKGDTAFAKKIYDKVVTKLKTEAIEDFRIDFEDGYGNRSNEEEDETAITVAKEVAMGMKEKTLSPFIGIRVKPFTEEMKERGLRTLDLFISTLVKETNGQIPDNFVVMLPKVTIPEQPETLANFFDILEEELGLQNGVLKMEMMVETTQAIMAIDGTNPLYKFIKASKGRCIAMHFGTYDYTASCSITAKYQEMDHPVCDFAHHVTKVALAHTGIWLSDGATNTMPIGPHSYDDAVERLKTFVEKAARATLIGDVFDDAATGQGLLNYFLRALNSGAITEQEVLATGLTLDEIRGRSFKQILENRKKK